MLGKEIKIGNLRIGVDGELLLKVDLLVNANRYVNRSDVVRCALRELFKEINWEDIDQIIVRLGVSEEKSSKSKSK